MNRLFTVLLLSAFSSFIFSPQVYANRPAMQDGGETTVSEEPAATEPQQQATSSVEVIMQHQTRQTGDVLQLPAQEIQPGETVNIRLLDTPRRGASMEKVKNELGQPAEISDSVGQPPITRWIYNDRVVYFEYSKVLHAVAR